MCDWSIISEFWELSRVLGGWGSPVPDMEVHEEISEATLELAKKRTADLRAQVCHTLIFLFITFHIYSLFWLYRW